MKFEELIEQPLHELDEDQIQSIIDELSLDQLAVFEEKLKKAKKKPRPRGKTKKKLEDDFAKAILGGAS